MSAAAALQWQSRWTPALDAKWLVKGTVLTTAYVPGTHHRFLLEEVRALEADGSHTVLYRLRDAATVSDADVRAGRYSKPVCHSYDLDECLRFALDS